MKPPEVVEVKEPERGPRRIPPVSPDKMPTIPPQDAATADQVTDRKERFKWLLPVGILLALLIIIGAAKLLTDVF